MIRSYYHCCCINEPVIISHCAHLKLGHRFHAPSKVCSDRDDVVPLKGMYIIGNVGKISSTQLHVCLLFLNQDTNIYTEQQKKCK